MRLLKAEFACTVLTPMFLSGVDQTTCEFRAPSLRGVMRYWYRALLGGKGVTDLDELKTQESAVFGSTEAASPVKVRITPVAVPLEQRGMPGDLPEWSSDSFNNPIKYLWYSVDLGDNNRAFIQPGTSFTVSFTAVLPRGKGETRVRHAFQETLTAFWLVAHLGSLGTRARRAAGSFSAQLVRTHGSFESPPFREDGRFDPGTVQNALGSLLPNPSAASTEFSTLGSNSRVWRSGLAKAYTQRDWTDAVYNIADNLKEFRIYFGKRGENDPPSGFPPDYDVVKEAIRHDRAPRTWVSKTSFGLPLMFSYGDKGKTTLIPDGFGRRASPLWIRIAHLPDGRFEPVMTWFAGAFLPNDDSQLTRQETDGTFSAPRKNLIPIFVRAIEDDQRNPLSEPLFPPQQ